MEIMTQSRHSIDMGHSRRIRPLGSGMLTSLCSIDAIIAKAKVLVVYMSYLNLDRELAPLTQIDVQES